MRRKSGLLHLTVSAIALAVPTTAMAQDNVPAAADPAAPGATTQNDEAIIVTGSRIRRNPLNQDAPVTFVDRADIDKTGLNSLNDVLQRLPSAGGGLNGKFNNSGNFGNPPDGGGVGAGAAEIDLRYLGSKRTLVLVDGLRYVNAASASGVPGSVDLNAIPEAMIERVEVLQDGASAIYGSDAIAGVVNIITKSGQKGFDARAQLGTYDFKDGFSQNYSLSWGNGDSGATRIIVGANFVKQNPISSGDRDISRFPNPYATSCAEGGCSSGTPLGRFILAGPDRDLTLIAPVIGRDPVLADYRDFISPDDRFNFAPYNFILTPLKRYGGFVTLHQDIGETTNFTGKLVYNRRESKNQAAPLPLFVGPDAGNGNLLDTITIDATNTYNPFGTLRGDDPSTPLVNEQTYYFIGRRVIEGGPRRYNQKVDTYYGSATLDGRFGANRDWFWDVNLIYGRNHARQRMLGNINAANLQNALGPDAACVAPCVPFNIFGGEGSITQEMLDYVGFIQNDSSKQNLFGMSANLAGNLTELPGGPLALAVGVEYRRLSGRFDPDAVVAAGLGSDIPALPTKGKYNVKEAYLELNAPLVADRPMLELLELSGAVRFSDYSSSGSRTTYKLGLNYKPIPDLRFRASYTTGFRAPTIGELYGTPSRFDQELADPCSADQSPSGTIAANCATLGVPVGYQQNNPQLSVLTSGNADLKPETSRGYNLGAVFAPTSLKGRVSIEANYYNIRVKDAIFAAAGEVLSRCVATLDPVACAAVSRTSSGQIASISGVLGNVNQIDTEGLDVNLNLKSSPMAWGTVGFSSYNTFLLNYDVVVPSATGGTVISREGTEQGSPDQAFPEWKSVNSLDWNHKRLGATLTGRYIKGVDESQVDNHLNDRFYVDFQARYQLPFMEGMGLAVGVNNLFDKDPPGCITCGLNNYDPGTYDVPGRYLYARVSVKM
jgi:iron complex outermembrane receptor protein